MQQDDIALIGEKLKSIERIILYTSSNCGLLSALYSELDSDCINGVELWHNVDGIVDNKIVKRISTSTMVSILQLYQMYDFSDKFLVVSESSLYGNLFSYINSGIFSNEDLAKALIGNSE